jgi:hypothetical protein
MKVFFILIAVVLCGCQQTNETTTTQAISDTLHTLFVQRSNRFSDSFHVNNDKAIMNSIQGHNDSAMYFLGKSLAYLEMESKELKK